LLSLLNLSLEDLQFQSSLLFIFIF
jgi:hypothetical protein